MGYTKSKLAVLAIGGNSLILDRNHQGIADQFEVTRATCTHICEIIQQGWNVVITHGNGPQVGFMLRRCELSAEELHTVPLDSIGANTQGSIGYMIQQSLGNELSRSRIDKEIVTVITQVRVDAQDPAFSNPSKPIGSFMEEAVARQYAKERRWWVKEDAGRGWRRVVPSPNPREIVELEGIRKLVDAGLVVIAVGGGGIPVIRNHAGKIQGVPAVIDKDYASALLAIALHADRFIISTAIPNIYLDFNKPTQHPLNCITAHQAKKYLAQGQFPEGSMGPKVQAVINYLGAGGKEAIITSPKELGLAMEGKSGTYIVAD